MGERCSDSIQFVFIFVFCSVMQKKQLRKEQALEYHSKGRPGKIEVVPTKEAKTQRDLSLAYSPGVAEPCKEIQKNVEEVYKYTAKGNLVAVITNGTAVLGLGDIGPEASKPVMEGKGVLFKIFADIDVFDIEINEKDPEKFVQIVKALEPTLWGYQSGRHQGAGVLLYRTGAASAAKDPVMHDDQHGTAIISSAALLNALELQKKKIDRVRFVINGAGAAAMACVKLYAALGAKPENFILFDKDGVLPRSGPTWMRRREVCRQKERLDAGEGDEGCGCICRVECGKCGDGRDGKEYGQAADRFCDGQSRSGDRL